MHLPNSSCLITLFWMSAQIFTAIKKEPSEQNFRSKRNHLKTWRVTVPSSDHWQDSLLLQFQRTKVWANLTHFQGFFFPHKYLQMPISISEGRKCKLQSINYIATRDWLLFLSIAPTVTLHLLRKKGLTLIKPAKQDVQM